jgi:hypothetical protein
MAGKILAISALGTRDSIKGKRARRELTKFTLERIA